jgi:hypothetical protein
MGFYDECIDIHHPVKGQYCLSEIKLIPSAENTISHNEVHNRNNIGSYYAWQNVLGVQYSTNTWLVLENNIFLFTIKSNNLYIEVLVVYVGEKIYTYILHF